MAHKTMVNGTVYEVTGGRTLIGGTGYSIKSGKTMINGTAYEVGFGTPIRSLAVGTSVYLNESGTPVEYIIVSQGIPGNSSLYDSSCDGTWLMRKDIYSTARAHANGNYASATSIKNSLNACLAKLDSAVQAIVKQIKIPYGAGAASSTVYSGASGLSTKAFLLSAIEVGSLSGTESSAALDGVLLDYFNGASNSDRIAYRNGTATAWWLRSPNAGNYDTFYIRTSGGLASGGGSTSSYGIRPAFILPSATSIDDNLNVIA